MADLSRDQTDVDTYYDYHIVEYDIPEEVYDQASDLREKGYFLERPHIHFAVPDYIQRSNTNA